MTSFFDFNDASAQRSFDVMPDNLVCAVEMIIKKGDSGPNQWLTTAKSGKSKHLNCEFTVLDGDYADRKFWRRFTVAAASDGTAASQRARDNLEQAIEISRQSLKAMLESARGIRPGDMSEKAVEARRTQGWEDFNGLRFIVRLGIEEPEGYQARNTIKEIITPGHSSWKSLTSPPF